MIVKRGSSPARKTARAGGHRHVPMRTCIACRQARPKRSLIRIVSSPGQEVEIDSTGKMAGRGAYLCLDPACWDTALSSSNVLPRALRTTISIEDRAVLMAFRDQELTAGSAGAADG